MGQLENFLNGKYALCVKPDDKNIKDIYDFFKGIKCKWNNGEEVKLDFLITLRSIKDPYFICRRNRILSYGRDASYYYSSYETIDISDIYKTNVRK